MTMTSLAITIVGAVAGLFLFIACLVTAIHTVEEGHVGLYYKYGALLNETTTPGIHWLQPFVTQVVQVQLTPETKTLNPTVCTTRDGVRIVFRDIEIVTSVKESHVLELVREYSPKMKHILVFDRVSESIQVFCANSSIDEVKFQ